MAMKLKDLNKYLDKLGGKVVNRASAKAINRALTTARKEATKIVRERYKLKSGDIKKLLYIEKAKANNKSVFDFGGRLKIKDKPIGLEKYGARHKRVKTGRGLRRGVTVNITGLRELVQGGFMAKGKVWKRKGPSRLSIKRLFGPSAAQVLEHKPTLKRLRKLGEARYREEFSRELAYQLQRRSGGR